MKTVLPTDCGNSPRITIVGEFVTAWAQRDVEAVSAWLTDDVAWTIVGREDLTGDRVAQDACLDSSVDILDVSAIVTHGRLASCDGVLETASGRVAFSHVFRFASTSKAAKIAQIRTYLIDTST